MHRGLFHRIKVVLDCEPERWPHGGCCRRWAVWLFLLEYSLPFQKSPEKYQFMN
jgi:hypothetical protein